RWVLCKHRQRNTYECPGGHRECGENITETAKRELWEETGAVRYDLNPVCVYSVRDDTKETFGMLYFAEISGFEPLPQLEIENIEFFKELPSAWTYPDIQPILIDKIRLLYDI
ncbi:MAG: NUDIX domain-containing protein, partial [Oscillospiraceae bacterium]|nr:NUDIX domain-containing protein [Oscillospiraceae bacterium]